MAVLRDTMVILLPPFSTRIAATIPLVAAAGHSAHATGHSAATHAAGRSTAAHAADEHERSLGNDGIRGRGTR